MSRPRLGASSDREFLGSSDDSEGWVQYHFAVVQAVPHVHLGARVNVGVVVHARTQDYLRARMLTDAEPLSALLPGMDIDVLGRYLATHQGVAGGDPSFGPIALAPPSERFHWLTAPRSDVIQCSRVHAGRSQDLDATLDDLFRQYVEGPE